MIGFSKLNLCFLPSQQWEGLIELLGAESGTPCGLDFLRKYYTQ